MSPPGPHTARAPLPSRLAAALAEASRRAPLLTLALAGLFVALSAWFAATRLQYHTQRADLTSPRKEHNRRWSEHVREFGGDDDVVLVAAGEPGRLREVIDAAADEVRRRPDLFDRLLHRVDLSGLRDRGLMYLSAEELRELQANLGRMSWLLSAGDHPANFLMDFNPYSWRTLSTLHLLSYARYKAKSLAAGRPMSDEDTQYFGQVAAVARSASAAVNGGGYSDPWGELAPRSRRTEGADAVDAPRYLSSADGSLMFLVCRPVQEAGSFTPAAAAVAALRESVGRLRERFPGIDVGLTGLPVLEDDEMSASKRDTTSASWLALAGVTLLYLVVYRGWSYPLLTVTTLGVGTAWALGWLTLTVGHVNILSATFAVMLIGLGDYGVLWVTRYDAERWAGADPEAAARATALHAGPGVLTAALTASLAFFATMLADFQAVAELGWVAGCGVLFCALSCFTVLPALLTLRERAGQRRRSDLLRFHDRRAGVENRRDFLPALSSRPHAVFAAAAVALAALALFAPLARYDHNLLRLQSPELESVRWQKRLLDGAPGAGWHALCAADTPADALALKQRLQELPEVSRVDEVASLLPADQGEKLPLVRDVRERLAKLPARGTTFAARPPQADTVRAAAAGLLDDIRPFAAASPLLTRLAGELAALSSGLAAQPADSAAARLLDFEARLGADLVEKLHKLRDAAHPSPVTTDDVPPPLRERFVGASGKWLLRVYAREDLWEYTNLRQFVDAVRSVDASATGKPQGTLEGLDSMKAGFEWAGVYALLAIVGVLWLDLRRPGLVALALLPLGLGALATLGVMGLAGLPLNPANLIAFPLIVGVCVDNGVHVAHDFRRRDRSRPYALGRATGRGIGVAALTTLLGFGTLATATHRGLAGLGLTLALGVAASMACALVLLPALLRLLTLRPARQAVIGAPRARAA